MITICNSRIIAISLLITRLNILGNSAFFLILVSTNFEFKGSNTSQWTQIGNAVPPIMAEAIGKAILKMFKNRNKKIKKIEKTNIEFIRSTAFNYEKDVYSSKKQLELNF